MDEQLIGGRYRGFRITPDDSESMRYLSKFHIRALKFIDRYHVETDPVWLSQLIYSVRNPKAANLVHMLGAVDLKGEMVAHALSYVDNYQTLGPVVICLQGEKDRSVDRESAVEMRRIAMELIKEWACSLKLKDLIIYALKPSNVRIDKMAGFSVFRTVMRLKLE
jgi:hypothetical protein